MQITLQSGDKIAIPAGCKAIVSDGYVLVEADVKKPKFKRGDFIAKNGDVAIFSRINIGDIFIALAFATINGKYYRCDENESFDNYHGWSYATTEECTQLLEAMHAVGKDWDFEKQEIVDWEWRPKIGEEYFIIDPEDGSGVMVLSYDNDSIDNINFKIGIAFRTRELAEVALEMLKQCKHY